MFIDPSRSPGLLRRILALIGLAGLVGVSTNEEAAALPVGDIAPKFSQYVRNKMEQRRNRRTGGKPQGSKAKLGNNRARRGGFKRRYSGHV